jgi:copper homeostasis protein
MARQSPGVLVEAAVESLTAALAAAEGGARRLELCVDLARGGTTPDLETLRAGRARLEIPIFVLVRPRAGDFVYSTSEHRAMLEQVRGAKESGAQGIGTGSLTSANAIDHARTAELVAAAEPLPVTFHRAFDVCVDCAAALEALVDLGVKRVLTSGGAPKAIEGVERIARLVTLARGRIGILPGGGIDASNVRRIVQETGVREVHLSAKDSEKVRRVIVSLSK